MLFDNEFEYTGQSILIKICYDGGPVHNSNPASIHVGLSSNDRVWVPTNNNTAGCGNPNLGGNSCTTGFPYFTLGVESYNPVTSPNEIRNVTVTHSALTPVAPGTSDVALLRVEIETRGLLDTMGLTNMVFNNKNLPGASSAKLYYTDNVETFNPTTASLLGTVTSATNNL